MRHNKKRGMKLGTDASHTKAMKRSLVGALLANDRIKTTLPRAKAIRGDVDRIITWAKKGDLSSRRNAIAWLGDAELVRETFEKAAQGMWADRNGGYTRIMKLGSRKGDNAEVVIMEVVTEAVTPKGAGKTEVKKATAKKAAKPRAAKKDAAKDADAEKAAEPKETEEAEEPKATESEAEVEKATEAKPETDDAEKAAEPEADAEKAADDKAE